MRNTHAADNEALAKRERRCELGAICSVERRNAQRTRARVERRVDQINEYAGLGQQSVVAARNAELCCYSKRCVCGCEQ